jgi:hypothetical protein
MYAANNVPCFAAGHVDYSDTVAKISYFENNNYTFGTARPEVCRERRISLRKCIKCRKGRIYRGSTHHNSFSGMLESPNVSKKAITFTAILSFFL